MAKKTDWTPIVILGLGVFLLRGGGQVAGPSGRLTGFAPSIQQLTQGVSTQAVNRTLSGAGGVWNNGNVTATYEVFGIAAVYDTSNVLRQFVESPHVTVTLAPGQRAEGLSYSIIFPLEAGWTAYPRTQLNITSPVLNELVDYVDGQPYTEPAQALGTLLNFTPSITGR